MGYYGYGGYAPQPTQAELRAKAAKMVKPGYKPVIIDGKNIARSWWGKSWCDNIERYARLSNRIKRGKSYVKGNAVIDLSINRGIIRAKVIGSRRTPYDVVIKIDPVNKRNYENILKVCSGKFESLSALEEGRFPEEYRELFTAEGKGLFPAEREIHFSCSCPDYTSVCKHVAAALCAVGRRLDDAPLMLLELRGIDTGEFSAAVLKKEAERIWASSGKAIDPERMMSEEEAMRLFGFERPPEEMAKEFDYSKLFKS